MRGAILVLVLAPTIAAAQAQITTDPTRPAIGVTVVETPEGAAPSSQLQSVMISPTRRAAIINGAVVELGGKYGDAVLMQVREDEVVLRSGTSRQVLKLYPAVDKKVQVVKAEPIAPAAKSGSPKPTPKAKAKPKPKTKPKASTESGAKPVAGSSAGAR